MVGYAVGSGVSKRVCGRKSGLVYREGQEGELGQGCEVKKEMLMK